MTTPPTISWLDELAMMMDKFQLSGSDYVASVHETSSLGLLWLTKTDQQRLRFLQCSAMLLSGLVSMSKQRDAMHDSYCRLMEAWVNQQLKSYRAHSEGARLQSEMESLNNKTVQHNQRLAKSVLVTLAACLNGHMLSHEAGKNLLEELERLKITRTELLMLARVVNDQPILNRWPGLMPVECLLKEQAKLQLHLPPKLMDYVTNFVEQAPPNRVLSIAGMHFGVDPNPIDA